MISAIILAAGESRRMGEPKMLLKWGNATILEHVISVFANAGIEDILVVTGSVREQIEQIVSAAGEIYPVRSVYNKDFSDGEMLSSLQCGLQDLTGKGFGAAMIGLGDQPQVQAGTVQLIRDAFVLAGKPIVVPSYQMRRGHPWLVANKFWPELLSMNPLQTPRNFLSTHSAQIHYVNIDNPSVLVDVDTPQDYQNTHP